MMTPLLLPFHSPQHLVVCLFCSLFTVHSAFIIRFALPPSLSLFTPLWLVQSSDCNFTFFIPHSSGLPILAWSMTAGPHGQVNFPQIAIIFDRLWLQIYGFVCRFLSCLGQDESYYGVSVAICKIRIK